MRLDDLAMMIKINGKVEAVYHYMQFNTLSVFNKIKRIIDNYNQNLTNFTGNNQMLALYILNEENRSATKNDTYYIMTANTSRLLRQNYEDVWDLFKAKKEVTTEGAVELDEESKSLHMGWIGKFDAGICVDFDTKKITSQYVFKVQGITEYCVENKILLCDFHMNDLPVVDVNLGRFNFNEIEDVIDFISKNTHWRMEGDNESVHYF